MFIRQVVSKEDMKDKNSTYLRDRLVVENLFKSDEFTWIQSHHDRLMLGGVFLTGKSLEIPVPEDFGTDFLLDRRELGLACLSGEVEVTVDDKKFILNKEDIIYVGRGTKRIQLRGNGLVYASSSMAHQSLPTTLVKKSDAETIVIGDRRNASERTLRKYIHDNGVASASMAMGITTLHEGNVWNTMPCHIHERRTEAYLYFDLPENQKVVHLYGEPRETRSFMLSNLQAVISPAWSIHTGAGTESYKFVWSTAGENITYTDFHPVPTEKLL